jgi:hypothetical protein
MSMSNLEELKDVLRMYSTHEQHPSQVDEAHAALGDDDLVVDALIWALQQNDIDLKLLVLQLLQHHYTDAKRALPAVRSLISDNVDRLMRITAINTLHLMGDTSDDLVPLLTPRLRSDDAFERILSAGNLWRINRSEDAFYVLRQEAAGDDNEPAAMMARSHLDETGS